MVIIEDVFIQFRTPSQYVYCGENYLDVYKKVSNKIQKTRRFENLSISSVEPGDFAAVARELGSVDVGVILNSSPLIFNIFEFEKIPWRKKMRNEVVEWRLRKVFPENIDEYDHQYFQLSRKKVFSMLIRNSLKNRIEELFAAHNLNLTYLGNSTVNIINRLRRFRKKPEFIIEADRNFLTLVFMERGLPYNIRKFRVENEAEAVSEILKTLNYLKNNYAKTPSVFAMVALTPHLDAGGIAQELAGGGLRLKNIKNMEQMAIPG